MDVLELTPEQAQAENAILDFLCSDHKIFLLQGYAGTGKTTLLRSVISSLKEDVAVTAPTNKAVKVLREKAEDKASANVLFTTIHSFFKCRREIDEKGNIDYIPVGLINEDCRILFIDECSMLDKKMFEKIILFTKLYELKTILIGDDCQINPVNESYSPSFRFKRYWQKTKLDKIIRQAEDSEIIPLSKDIRLHINKPFSLKRLLEKNACQKQVQVLSFGDKNQTSHLINSHFVSDNYTYNSDYVKILAWTNSIVNSSNNRIREILYGENRDFIEVGETLIANTPCIYYRGGNPLRMPTNSEFRIVKKHERSETYTASRILDLYPHYIRKKIGKIGNFNVDLHYYYCHINYQDLASNYITILKERSLAEFDFLKKTIRTIAKTMTKTEGGEVARQAWGIYYNFEAKFADYKYNHALTVHKSQGSTYENVFVYAFDLMKNPNIQERNRILYTAVTRASKKLYIIL